MKKTLKWLFIAPFIFFGVWLIALFSERLRADFINSVELILKIMEREIERSL